MAPSTDRDPGADPAAHPGDGIDTLILDVDGTLVDSNYQHALAWYLALLGNDVVVPVWQIHRSIGMGGDKLVAHVAGEQVERDHGDELRESWTSHFEPMIPQIRAFADTERLLRTAREAGLRVVVASSGQRQQVETFLDLFHGRQLADDWTTSEDAKESKPAPDLLEVAMDKVGARPAQCVMVGDSTWDAASAGRAGVPCVAVMTGGFSEQELREAGAVEVMHDLGELVELVERGRLQRLEQA